MRRAIALAWVLAPAISHAGFFARTATVITDRLAAVGMAHAPPPEPPTPVRVTWKPVRIGTIDRGAPLVAIAGADLDGDKKPELYAITAHEIVAYGIAGGKLAELGRAALVGEPAVPRSRDVFGDVRVDGGGLVAFVSSYATPVRVAWNAKQLVVTAAPGVDPTCVPGIQPQPGRNFFSGNVYAARCCAHVDAKGAPHPAKAVLATTSKLSVSTAETVKEYPLVGTTYELADIDRDGKLEIIIAGAGAPGDVDAVKVMTFPDDKAVFRKAFAGGVVGIAIVDEGVATARGVIVAVRLVGSTRVDLWRLD